MSEYYVPEQAIPMTEEFIETLKEERITLFNDSEDNSENVGIEFEGDVLWGTFREKDNIRYLVHVTRYGANFPDHIIEEIAAAGNTALFSEYDDQYVATLNKLESQFPPAWTLRLYFD